MNQICVAVFNGELHGCPRQLCDARALHTLLGVGRDFSTWFRDRIDQYGFVEGEDFSPISGKSTGGRPCQEYHLTLDTAKELAMVENTEQGRQVRRYFITMEHKARENRGAAYLSVSQRLAIHRQVPSLLAKLKAETSAGARATLHAQLTQHCHQLALPVPSLDDVGHSVPETMELFPKG